MVALISLLVFGGIGVLMGCYSLLIKWRRAAATPGQGCLRGVVGSGIVAAFCGVVWLFVSQLGHPGQVTEGFLADRVPVATADKPLSPFEQQLAYDDADRRLNVAYKGLFSRLDSRDQQQLKSEQLQWLSQLKGVTDLGKRITMVGRRADELNTRWMKARQ